MLSTRYKKKEPDRLLLVSIGNKTDGRFFSRDDKIIKIK